MIVDLSVETLIFIGNILVMCSFFLLNIRKFVANNENTYWHSLFWIKVDKYFVWAEDNEDISVLNI